MKSTFIIEGDKHRGHALAFSPAKINIGLYVLRKRPDNYHDILSVLHFIPFYDTIEVWWEESPEDSFSIQIYGSNSIIPGNDSCTKTLKIIRDYVQDRPTYKIHLYLLKNIFVGGGLGGGSSNAVAFLKILSWLYDITGDLQEIALKIGADAPFFLINTPTALVSEVGTVVRTFPSCLTARKLLLANPGFESSTEVAYQSLTPDMFGAPQNYPEILISEKPAEWKDKVENIFERILFERHPALKNLKDFLYEEGAEYVSLTGTGSTIYAIFPVEFKINMSRISHSFPDFTFKVIYPFLESFSGS